MTINQRLILYKRAKKIFENRLKGSAFHEFKINQYKTLYYQINHTGICYTINKIGKDITKNFYFNGYDIKNTPEIYKVGLKEGYNMECGYYLPTDYCTKEGLIERIEFLEKVIKYTKKCIKK